MKNVSHNIEPPRDKQIFRALLSIGITAEQLLINTHKSYYEWWQSGIKIGIITTIIKMNPK